ncbi:MAG: HAD family hydrolase [Gammaproteobacteria bacterium]|nr:HAD family hydrolase [Gammaproteobacteria bacterium]
MVPCYRQSEHAHLGLSSGLGKEDGKNQSGLVFDWLEQQGALVPPYGGSLFEQGLANRKAVLGIDHVHSRLTPNQKIKIIRSYQAGEQRIAMVGDGMNDGPALAQADVGIAMSSGSEIALKSAPVVLMRADLRLIPEAIHYARKTRQVIRQNLGWAFGYNLLCIPLAMSGLLTPSIAGAAMALSSVSVVINALRLKYSD